MKYFIVILMSCALAQCYLVDKKTTTTTQASVEKETTEETKDSILDNFNGCEDDDDLTKNTTLYCHGLKIARRAMGKMLDQGLELVSVVDDGARSLGEIDNTTFGRVQGYLKSHELKVKLQDMLPNGGEWGRALKGGFAAVDEETGRGKLKKQLGPLLALALMFKGMLAAIGFKALALLTLKALMMGSLALTLAGIVAVKSLTSKGHGGQVTIVPVSGSSHGGGEAWRRVSAEENVSPYRGYEVYEKPEITQRR